MNCRGLELQRKLASYYRRYMSDPAYFVDASAELRALRDGIEELEDAWMKQEISEIDIATLPTDKEEFLQWYRTKERAINVDIAEFIEFLQLEATLEQVAYYICMEEMVDGSFDDLMAMVQIGMPMPQKMAAARNYWDELGGGNFELVHATMFRTSSNYLRKRLERCSISIGEPKASCLMNGNILMLMAIRRDYNLRLVGAIGLVEGSAPKRFSATTKAMHRLRLPTEVIEYHKAHITIDSLHRKDWFDNVLTQYAGLGKGVIRELSLGVEIRYRVAIEYYESMLHDLRHMHQMVAEV